MKTKNQDLKKGGKTDLTTAQVSSFLRVGTDSLYKYVRNFPEFFSPGARKHTAGRKWTPEDLEMCWTIRTLYAQRTGTPEIRRLLEGGWKLQNVQIWTKQLMALLLEQSLDSQDKMQKAAQEVVTLKRLIQERDRDNEELQKMWIQLNDLQHEWEVMQKAWRLRTVITKAVKKKYHGKLPELYPPKDAE